MPGRAKRMSRTCRGGRRDAREGEPTVNGKCGPVLILGRRQQIQRLSHTRATCKALVQPRSRRNETL
eukprot:9009962-Pyramimonas_sp.AAC.1